MTARDRFLALSLTFLILADSASHGAAQTAQTITPDPKVAADLVMRLFTPNPAVVVEATHKPLPTTGSWGVQMKPAGNIPKVCESSTMSCVKVVYRVPEAGVVCFWTIGFIEAPTAQQSNGIVRTVRPVVVDEDASAALYTMKKQWAEGDPPINMISKVAPSYPLIAKSAHAEGTVSVRIVVGPDGNVEAAQATAGPMLLQQAALDAAKRWKYEPLTIGSQHASFQTYAMFAFTMGGPGGASVSANMGHGDGAYWPSSNPHAGAAFAPASSTFGGTWVQCSYGVGCTAAGSQIQK
jgi:TonB family protein